MGGVGIDYGGQSDRMASRLQLAVDAKMVPAKSPGAEDRYAEPGSRESVCVRRAW